jgi:hypothetical protein
MIDLKEGIDSICGTQGLERHGFDPIGEVIDTHENVLVTAAISGKRFYDIQKGDSKTG